MNALKRPERAFIGSTRFRNLSWPSGQGCTRRLERATRQVGGLVNMVSRIKVEQEILNLLRTHESGVVARSIDEFRKRLTCTFVPTHVVIDALKRLRDKGLIGLKKVQGGTRVWLRN